MMWIRQVQMVVNELRMPVPMEPAQRFLEQHRRTDRTNQGSGREVCGLAGCSDQAQRVGVKDNTV